MTIVEIEKKICFQNLQGENKSIQLCLEMFLFFILEMYVIVAWKKEHVSL